MQKRKMLILLCCLLVMVLAIAGCDLLGIGSSAKMSKMIPGMSTRMDKLECWLTIEFKKYPEGIDPLDVEIIFSSIALVSDQIFQWEYIAKQDVVAKGLGKGYGPNENTVGDAAPPLKEKIKVKYPLQAKPELELELTDTIWLTVELYWGGKKQGQMQKSIEHVYHRTI